MGQNDAGDYPPPPPPPDKNAGGAPAPDQRQNGGAANGSGRGDAGKPSGDNDEKPSPRIDITVKYDGKTLTYEVKADGQKTTRIEVPWKDPKRIPDPTTSWHTQPGAKPEIVIIVPKNARVEDLRSDAQKDRFDVRPVKAGDADAKPRPGGSAKTEAPVPASRPHPSSSAGGAPAKKTAPEAPERPKAPATGDAAGRPSSGGAPSLRQGATPERDGGDKGSAQPRAPEQPKTPADGKGDGRPVPPDSAREKASGGDAGRTTEQTSKGPAPDAGSAASGKGADAGPAGNAAESGTHAPGGKGEVRQGAEGKGAEGGHGHDRTAENAKDDLDYAMLFNEMLDPAFIHSLMSIFDHSDDTVTSGGAPEGIGAKDNASKIGQAGIGAANVLFAFFDTILAGGRKALQSFSNKKAMIDAFKREVKAGRIVSQSVRDIRPGGPLTAGEAAGADAFRDAILNGKGLPQAGTIAHEAAGANVGTEAFRYGTSNSPVVKPGPDFVKHGGAAAQEIKFHAGYISPEQLQHATAQTMVDNVLYQKATDEGLVKLRLPTIHIYVDLRTGEAVKWLQKY